MFKIRIAIVLGILLLSAIALPWPAFSEASLGSDAKAGIELTPIIVALINLAFPAIAGVATYLINAHLKNQQMAALLSNAIQNGLGIVQQRTAAALRRTDLTVRVESPDIQAGVQYVLQNATEAIAHFDIPTERIAQKLEAKLGLAEIATNLAATASTAPVVTGPLAPAPTTERIEVTRKGL